MGACSTGCPTPGAHASWGECMRSKNLRIAYANSAHGHDLSQQKRWDANLQRYRDARAQGVQPAGTSDGQIHDAMNKSEAAGVAFDASSVGRLDDSFTKTILEKG